MSKPISGLLAGLAAALVLSALMLLKGSLGMLPQLNVVTMLAGLGGNALGIQPTPMLGWALHVPTGTVLWGLLFALVGGMLPGNSWTLRGMLFSIGAWLLMMLVLVPLVGAGFFALDLGVMAPVATLVLHVIFGAVMGVVYGALIRYAPQRPVATAAR